jgi:hypothetical protein
MRHLVSQLFHLLVTVMKLVGSGSVRSVVAESLVLKHQLLIVNLRTRERGSQNRVWRRPYQQVRGAALAEWALARRLHCASQMVLSFHVAASHEPKVNTDNIDASLMLRLCLLTPD